MSTHRERLQCIQQYDVPFIANDETTLKSGGSILSLIVKIGINMINVILQIIIKFEINLSEFILSVPGGNVLFVLNKLGLLPSTSLAKKSC